MTLSIEICEGEPDSMVPLGANVVQLFAGFEGPPQLSEPHDAESDGLGAAAAGVGAPLHTKLFQHSLEQSWDPGRCNQQQTSFAKVARVLSLGTLHSQHQMLFFSCEISLSDWFYHLFPSPWAIVGWTLFLLFVSILLRLLCLEPIALCWWFMAL